jgi:hypothetical protein
MYPNLPADVNATTIEGFISKRQLAVEAQLASDRADLAAKKVQASQQALHVKELFQQKQAKITEAYSNLQHFQETSARQVLTLRKFYQQREDLKTSVFEKGRSQLLLSSGTTNYPPFCVFTPETTFSKLKASSPGLQWPLHDATFVYADITSEPGTLAALKMEVKAIQKEQAGEQTIAIRCLVDQMQGVYKLFASLNMFADAPFVIGSTQPSLTLQTLSGSGLYDEAQKQKYLHPHHKSGPLSGLVSGYILTFCSSVQQLKELQRKALATVKLEQPEEQDAVVTGILCHFTDWNVAQRNSGYVDPYMFKLHLSQEENKFWSGEFPEWLAVLWYLATRGVKDAQSHIWSIGGKYDELTTATSILGATIVVFPEVSAPVPSEASVACASPKKHVSVRDVYGRFAGNSESEPSPPPTLDYVVSTSRTAVSANLMGTTTYFLV